MKVLLLTRHFPPHEGAIATWSFEMAARLGARCEDFSVCGVGPGAFEIGRASGVGFEPLRPAAVQAAVWGLGAARGRRFDVVLGSDWVAGALGLAWRARSNPRCAFAVAHGPELEWPGARAPLRRVYRRTCALALGRFDAVFAASGLAEALLAEVPLRRRELVGRACDPARFRPAERGPLARELGLLERRVLLSVGKLVPTRRIDKVLFAVSALGVRYPDLCYVIAGDGPERERLELLAERLRIPHKVRFLGRVDAAAMPEVYNLCDIFVHLSGGGRRGLAELDGAALLEAQACGRAVVVSAHAAAAEGLDEQTALVVPEDDSIALADALRSLLDEPQRAAGLGEAARGRVVSNATWDLAADRLVTAMTDAARGTREARASNTGSRAALRSAVLVQR